MLKKMFFASCFAVASVGFFACGGEQAAEGTETEETTEEVVEEETAEEPIEATEEVVEEAVEEVAPADSTEKPAEEAPVAE